MPGITFPTSGIGDYNAKEYYLSKTGGKWAVHKMSLGKDQWTDEIVALETEFMVQTDAKYTNLDKSRLLRDFMKFVPRIRAHAIWLIVSTQFPQPYLQKFQGFHYLCWHWGEDFERLSTVPGVDSQITPGLAGQVGPYPLHLAATPPTMENPSSYRPRSFYVYPCQCFCCSVRC